MSLTPIMKHIWFHLISFLPLGETTVRFRHGTAKVIRGKVRSAVISEFNQLAKEADIQHGCIQIRTTKEKGSRLFFYGIPESAHQRFRNVWTVQH